MKEELSLIGKSVPRMDGAEKVTGKAQFVYDMNLPGMLHAKILRSPHAHAKIISIDTSKAKIAPGVHAVITGKDLNENLFGPGLYDLTILAKDRVRFIGQGVAAVAAETETLAENALKYINVEYEILPAVFDVEKAFDFNPPVIIHPDLYSYDYSQAMKPRFVKDRPNVFQSNEIVNGDLESGFERADLIVENKFSVARIQHCQMEPYVAIVQIESDEGITVWSSTSTIHPTKNLFCNAFNLKPSKVRVISPYIGGGFGGKQDIFPIGVAYGLAAKTGRPVKMAFSRKEQFIGAVSRHPAIIEIRDGVTKDGILVARDIRILMNSGAYAENGFLVTRNCAFGSIATYKVPNFRFRSYGVYTNEPISGAFRGLGNTQVEWAIESNMDIIAVKLNIDPLEFRKLNLLRKGDINAGGEFVYTNAATKCVKVIEEKRALIKKELLNNDEPNIRRGIGIALANKYSLAPTAACAIVKVYEDGCVEARVGVEELGQGMKTVMGQIAGEEFGVDMSDIKVISGDTLVCPYDEAAVSSRATYNTGNAVRLACLDAKQQIFKLAEKILGVHSLDLDIDNKYVFVREHPDKCIHISELFVMNKQGYGHYLREGAEIIGKATWYQGVEAEVEGSKGNRLTAFYTHGAQMVVVAVDIETGQTTVEKIYSVFDAGKAINPILCEGQIEGGVGMGISSALFEEVKVKDGVVLNPSFTDCILPMAKDFPYIDNNKTFLVEESHKDGPFGAIGLGEGTMIPTAPAIANAISNAIGIRAKRTPITPEDILKLLEDGKR